MEWNHEHETALNNSKKQLTQEPVLRFYDPARPIKISSDVSQSGLFCCRSTTTTGNQWNMHIVQWLTLRPTEIEKELLSITYACERFHQFVSGQVITVETDHKPLILLFQKPLNECPLKVQRMMIKLQRYALNVAYTPGKMMYTLSRASTKADKEVRVYVEMITTALKMEGGNHTDWDRKRHNTDKHEENNHQWMA